MQDRVNPLLAAASSRVQEILKAISSKGEEAKGKAQDQANGHTNGNGAT